MMKRKATQLLKQITSSFLALLLITAVFTGFPAVMAAEDTDGVVIKLHYNRPDGSYDGWDVWFWAEGKDGNGYPFAEEDGEMVSTFTAESGVARVGFIVRTASWDKDVNADQFIDIADVVSGTVHVYVESGVEGYTRELGENAVTGLKILGVRYDMDKNVITVTTTGEVPDSEDSFTLSEESSGGVAIIGVEQSGEWKYNLTPESPLDMSGAYKVEYDGTKYDVVLPNIYSTDSFEADYTYTGDDLGASWTAEKTVFRVWAPTASAVAVNLYESGTAGTNDLTEQLPMTKDVNGTWVAEKSGDLNGTYYTYSVTVGGQENEACDPYARTTGVNGNRAMVIDLASTDPEGWENDGNPNADLTYNDAIIYELHVRDISSDSSSGITNTGKFLGLTETGTTTSGGIPTGIDHIKDLGITHLHLLPVYDYGSVDETKLDTAQFNWGYDPVNYNVPEGSYSTDPYNGEVRVKEMKQMVQALHNNGISVVMDVVYNHVYNAGEFCFNKIVPGYFSRIDDFGIYSNGSGCGNDTASERSMVRKYIVDSVKYWADEYHIDGFRFDLVGLLDVETINQIVEEVHKDHPSVIFYGEGWSMTTNVTKPGVTMATQTNSAQTPGFAYFSDTIRDALKGSVFDKNPGYVSGNYGQASIIQMTFKGLTSWCTTPAQTINYASCHDNNTLIDRITLSVPEASREDIIKMNNLAAAIYLTAEGIPFMQAGEEMLRTKPNADGTLNENSYNASDEVNSIKWDTLEDEEYRNVYEYYKGLIEFRKAHPALRLTNAEDVKANVTSISGLDNHVVAFDIKGGVNGETADELYIIFNPNNEAQEIELPEGTWNVCINGETAGTKSLATINDGKATVDPISAMVLVKGELASADSGSEGGSVLPWVISAGAAAVAAGVAAGIVISRKKGGKKDGKKG